VQIALEGATVSGSLLSDKSVFYGDVGVDEDAAVTRRSMVRSCSRCCVRV